MSIWSKDADFDSYWEDEARNPNRNRIRIGRQYQASVPPLLKPGENDGRKLEELETLNWQPRNNLTDQQLDQYLSLAKAVTLFARAISNSNTSSSNNATAANNSSSNCETINNESDDHSTNSNSDNQHEEDQKSSNGPEKSNENGDSNKDCNSSMPKDVSTLQQLSEFVIAHHPSEKKTECKVQYGEDFGYASCMKNWSSVEMDIFVRALEECGKNFSAIKKEYLPWKSVQSLIEFYYTRINRAYNSSDRQLKMDCDSNPSTYMIPDKEIPSPSRSPPVNNNSSTNGVNNGAKMDECNLVNEINVKAMNANPIRSNNTVDGNAASNMGFLKFYMDGQLVLKLNAKQENLNKKCSWVESQDTPKLPRPVKRGNKKFLIERNENNHSALLDEKSNEDGDEASDESSDDDSLASSESNFLSSPMSVTSRKAKVKVENNCYVPLPSPLASPLASPGPTFSSNRTIFKQESFQPSIKRELTSSPTRLFSRNNDYDVRKKVIGSVWQFDKRRSGGNFSDINSNSYSNFHMSEKVGQPPAAHAASRVMNNATGSVNNIGRMSDVLIPVDLTRKSSTCSPNHTKSPSTVSSPSTCSSWENEMKSEKVSSPPSPPKSVSPLNYSQSTPISPQMKSGKGFNFLNKV